MTHIKTNDVASSVPFDNSTNGFTSTDTQAAVEEARRYSEGFPRAGLTLIANGTTSNNQWVAYTDLLPNTPVGPWAVNVKLHEISWSNTTSNVSFDLEFYKNGTAIGNLFHTLQVRSTNPGYGYVNGLTYEFAAGDYLKVKYIDQGTNATDLAVILWISRIP
jgi:hypothetical protein